MSVRARKIRGPHPRRYPFTNATAHRSVTQSGDSASVAADGSQEAAACMRRLLANEGRG